MITSCLDALFRRIGGMSATLQREGGRLSGSATRQGGLDCSAAREGGRLTGSASRMTGMACSFGLVCSTSLGDECLWASDQMVLTVDGGKVYVTRT